MQVTLGQVNNAVAALNRDFRNVNAELRAVSTNITFCLARAYGQPMKKPFGCDSDSCRKKAKELERSIMYMYALKEQAIGLMSQPLHSQYNAGPTFEYSTN